MRACRHPSSSSVCPPCPIRDWAASPSLRSRRWRVPHRGRRYTQADTGVLAAGSLTCWRAGVMAADVPTLTCREGQDCRRGGEAADRDAGDGSARAGSKGGAGPVTVICRRYQHADVVVLIPRMAWHGIASFQLRVSSLSARFWRVSGLSGVRLACVCSNKLHGLRYQPAPSLVPRPSSLVAGVPRTRPASGHCHGAQIADRGNQQAQRRLHAFLRRFRAHRSGDSELALS